MKKRLKAIEKCVPCLHVKAMNVKNHRTQCGSGGAAAIDSFSNAERD